MCKSDYDQESDKCKYNGWLCEASETNKSRIIIYSDSRTLHTDKCDKDTDTGCDTVLEILRDTVDDRLSEFEQRKNDENDTFNKNSSKCDGKCICSLISKLAQTNGKCEVRIKSHSGRKSYRIVGKKSHDKCRYCRCDSCGKKNTVRIHNGSEDVWIYSKDVSHSEKCSATRCDLSLDISAVFLEFKDFFEHCSASFEVLKNIVPRESR